MQQLYKQYRKFNGNSIKFSLSTRTWRVVKLSRLSYYTQCVKVDTLGRLCNDDLEKSYIYFTITNTYFIRVIYNSTFTYNFHFFLFLFFSRVKTDNCKGNWSSTLQKIPQLIIVYEIYYNLPLGDFSENQIKLLEEIIYIIYTIVSSHLCIK